MGLRLRLVVPLVVSVAIVSTLFAAYQVRTEQRHLRADLQHRAEVLAESLQETIEYNLENHSYGNLRHIVNRFGHREHLMGTAVYDDGGRLLAASPELEKLLPEWPRAAQKAVEEGSGQGQFSEAERTPLYIYAVPLTAPDGGAAGTLVLVHNAAYISAEIRQLWSDELLRALVQTFFIAVIAVLIIRWTFTAPIARISSWVRSLRTGDVFAPPPPASNGLMEPLAHEVTHLAKSLGAARAAAEEEARLREAGASLWTAERLRVGIRGKLANSPLFVVSNREPYEHMRNQNSIQVVVPASGLVTALEPILIACDGTWIALGSGDADREVVDARDCLRVPPEHPQYTLRRVWLTPEEFQGYYLGFANEGLWPLCHIAHTRPIFRPEDWNHYRLANHKFAEAALEEMAGIESPLLLLQDYHFALLPRLIKEQRPDARVAIFWHIPWPNPEAFRICPWQRDLLEGLLGADLIGFHVQAHCNNFLETVDRALEALTEWDRFSVNRQGHLTLVRPFPISVAGPEAIPAAEQSDRDADRRYVLKEIGFEVPFLGVGVDRVDYTKGILERFRAVEHFFEEYSAYRGQFSFVQIAAPSRTGIQRYHDLLEEVEAEAARINGKFQSNHWRPIVLRRRHHGHAEINRFYRAADLCLVTSLHDGMNLVAKEFVAARDDDQGVLILSDFTGAARELPDALIVNPYDVAQVAAAIAAALEMPTEQRASRMRHMRQVVKENNVYRWAGNLLTALADIRVEKAEGVGA